jgi:DNA-binding NarL/FixJ family response regulator
VQQSSPPEGARALSAPTTMMVAVPPVAEIRGPLVGRATELDRLAGLVGLSDGAGGIPESDVLLSGDAGVGKTRLLAELRHRALEAGHRVLVGHCLDFGDSALPYLPFSEAFGRLATESPALAQSLVEAAPAIARLMPARRVLPSPSAPPDVERLDRPADGATDEAPEDPHLDRPDLFAAVHTALETLGRAQPLLLLVEDVHWADRSTREMLSYLFSRRFTAPVAIVASYRSDDLHRRHPLRQTASEWARLPAVTRIDLAPLGENDVRSLVESLHPEPLSERAVRGIVDRAEGNAFFTEELVQAADLGPDAMPWGLVDVLLVRLDRLDEDARLVVRAASASGRRVPHALLQSVVGDRVTSLDSALRTAVERNVLLAMGNDGYAFRHALLAEAIYDDLLPGERVQLHAAYMAALQKGGVGGTAAELARHARAANDVVTAAHASVAAGDEAMTVAGPDEALRHYETALELVTDQEADPRLEDIDPVELTARACEAAVDAGQTYRAIALARDQLGKLPRGTFPHKRLRLLRVLAAAAIVADIDSGALTATTEALQLLEAHPDEKLRARVLSLHARANSEARRTAEATRFANEALELGDRLGLADVVADARTTLARLRERRGETAASIALLEESVRQAAAAGELGAELRGMFSLGTMQYESGDIAAARESYARTIQRARDAGRPWAPYGMESRVLGIQAAYVLGDWDAAAAMADLREDSPPDVAEAMLLASGMMVRAGRGEQAALDVMPSFASVARREGMVALFAGLGAIDLHGDRGDVVSAISTHDDIVANVGGIWGNKEFQGRIRLSALLIGVLASAVHDTSTDDLPDLVERADDLLDVAERIYRYREETIWDEGPEGLAWLARVRAEHARLHWLVGDVTTDLDELVAAWRRAVEGFETFGHVFETARSQARLAAVLRAGGRSAEADEVAALATAVARRLRAEPLLQELRLSTGPGRRTEADRRDETLTSRELEVIVLVAEGLSNREIAGRLFISAKTVSVHVSNILAKLGAAGRTEAVAIARRRGYLRD